MVAVNSVFSARFAAGVNMAAWLAASYVTEPFTGTGVVDGGTGGLVRVKFAPTIVRGSIESSKVAVIFVGFGHVPFALSRGFVARTRGAVPAPPSVGPNSTTCWPHAASDDTNRKKSRFCRPLIGRSLCSG